MFRLRTSFIQPVVPSRRVLGLATAVVSLAVGSLLPAVPARGNAPASRVDTNLADAVTGEVVIQLVPGRTDDPRPGQGDPADKPGLTGRADLDQALVRIGATSASPVFDLTSDRAAKQAAGMDRVLLVHYANVMAPGDAARLLAGSTDVAWAEPNVLARVMTSPDDPLYPSQWEHRNRGQAVRADGGLVGTADCDLDTDEAWELLSGSASVTLAVIDTGVDTGHPEFAGRVVAGYDFVNGDADPADDNGHGTACAGVAAAAGGNGQGIAGVAWGVRLMPVKVLDASGVGSGTAIACGITFAADNRADILSLSLGGPASPVVELAIDYAVKTKGRAVFAAAGNGGASSLEYPARYPGVIAVGALSPCNERKTRASCDGESWWASDYGANLAFLAPGTRIHTTDIRGAGGLGPGDYVGDFNGTSAATPAAAGVGALAWSQNPSLTAAGLAALLESTSDDLGAPGYDIQTGYGRLNARRAVAGARGGVKPRVTLLSEGFEAATVPGDTWSSVGSWGDQSTAAGARAHSGSWSVYCADDAGRAGQLYDHDMNAPLALATPVDVTGCSRLELSFWKWHRTFDAGDYLAFEYWNGASWVEVQRWWGNSGAWQHLTYSLAGFTTLDIRFVFVSNASGEAEGAYLDDILLTGVPAAGGFAPQVPEPMHVTLTGERTEIRPDSVVAVSGDESVPAIDSATRVFMAAPNPFAEGTTVGFSLRRTTRVSLAVFSTDGRRVATLAEGVLAAGDHAVAWAGRDDRGREVAPGVYHARLMAVGDEIRTCRLVVKR